MNTGTTREPHRSLSEPFRTLLRGMASSVTIVSTESAKTRYGMIATAVMSLSLDPPALVLAVNRSASIHVPLHARGAFVINVLSRWDEAVARGFTRANGEDRFAFGPWTTRRAADHAVDGLPYLANAQAVIFCRLLDTHQAGTHSLLTASVVDLAHNQERAPLVYCDGVYGSFVSTLETMRAGSCANFAGEAAVPASSGPN
jgi:flavin reductase (DIM6/NTAB) family NADH-FMN oxidoreductase RutF